MSRVQVVNASAKVPPAPPPLISLGGGGLSRSVRAAIIGGAVGLALAVLAMGAVVTMGVKRRRVSGGL